MRGTVLLARIVMVAAAVLNVAAGHARASWQTFGYGEGLPTSLLSAVYQDREGSLWFGSFDGTLTRYDGVSWATYTLPSRFEIVSAILEHTDGTIWVTSNQGIYRVAGEALVAPAELFGGEWTCLLEDREGFLWAGNKDALARYDGATVRWYWSGTGLPGDRIFDLALSPDGAVVAATDGGLARFDGVGWSATGGGGPPEGQQVYRVAFAPDGAAWVAFRDDFLGTVDGSGVARFDGTTWTSYTVASGFPSVTVSGLSFDLSGHLWVSTPDSGIASLNDGRWRRLGIAEGLPSEHANDLIVDRYGAVWVATDLGAARFDGELWSTPSTNNGWPQLPIQSMAKASDGSLWFATANSGVYRLRNDIVDRFGAVDSLGTDAVRRVAATPDGSVWFATDQALVEYANGVWRRHTEFTPASIATDPMGRLVFRSGRGIWRSSGAGFERIATDYFQSFQDSTRVSIVDHLGGVWLTRSTSVFRLAPGDTLTSPVPGLPGFGFGTLVIGESAEGTIWISGNTATVRQEGDSWIPVSRTDGLLEQRILSMEADHLGATWFGFSGGIGRLLDGEWIYYTSPSLFGSGGPRPILDAQDGSLFVGSADGWLRYERDRVPPHAAVLPPGPPRSSPNPTQAFSFAGSFREVNGLEFSTSLDSEPWSPWSASTLWLGSGLTDGVHEVQVRARDPERNVDPYPAKVTFEIDATPPAPVISSPPFGGSVAGVTTIVGTASDARFSGYRLEVTPTGEPWPGTLLAASVTPVVAGNLSTWDTTSYPDGSHDLRLSVTDSLGLVGTAQISVIVDNEFPFVEETAPASVSAMGGDVFTTDRALHLYFPPGAFPRGATVSITTERGTTDTLGTGVIQVSPAYRLDWSAPLAKPAVSEFSAGGSRPMDGIAVYRSIAGGGWELAGGTVAHEVIALAVAQAGRYALFAGGPPPAEDDSRLTKLSFSPRVFSPIRTFAADNLRIGFTLGRAAPVTVRIYNRAGRLVREVLSAQEMPPGSNVVRWDGYDRGGVPVADGIYVVTVQSMGETKRGTVAIVR